MRYLFTLILAWSLICTAHAQSPKAESPDRVILTKVRVLPKPGTAAALAGVRIVGSNEGPTTAFVELARIDQPPAADGWVEVALPGKQVYRYVKLESLKALTLAEIEFHSPAGKLSGKGFGTSVPRDKSAVSFDKALDSDPATTFEAATDNSYVGIDLGSAAQAPTPRFKPGTGALTAAQKIDGQETAPPETVGVTSSLRRA